MVHDASGEAEDAAADGGSGDELSLGLCSAQEADPSVEVVG